MNAAPIRGGSCSPGLGWGSPGGRDVGCEGQPKKRMQPTAQDAAADTPTLDV